MRSPRFKGRLTVPTQCRDREGCWCRVHHLTCAVAQTRCMAERVRVREITSVEGNKLFGIVRRGSGSVVRWRIAIVLDSFGPHLATKKDPRVAEWTAANNVALAYTPTDSSWLNRIEAQFQALRYFALDGTGKPEAERAESS